MANRCKLIWPSIIIYFTPAALYTLWKEMLLLLVLWSWRIKHEGMTPEKRFKFYTAGTESSSRLSLLTAEKSFRAYFRQFFNVPFPKNWTVSVLPDVSSQALWSIEIELSTNQNQEKLIFKGFPVDNIRGCLFFLCFSLCQCSKLDLWMRGLSYLNYSCFVCVCVCVCVCVWADYYCFISIFYYVPNPNLVCCCGESFLNQPAQMQVEKQLVCSLKVKNSQFLQCVFLSRTVKLMAQCC